GLAIVSRSDLSICVATTSPVRERQFCDAKLLRSLTRIRLGAGRMLLRIVPSAAPYALLAIVDTHLSGWLVVLQILPRFPIGRQRRVSVRLRGFQRILVPVDDRGIFLCAIAGRHCVQAILVA